MRKTETVALNDHDRQKINLALDQLESNLSDKIDLDVVEAKRYAGDENPAFFSQGYVAGPVDEGYTRFVEVYCAQNMDSSSSWECKYNANAVVFNKKYFPRNSGFHASNLVHAKNHLVWSKKEYVRLPHKSMIIARK